MNVFQYIRRQHTCQGYEPPRTGEPTSAPPGSRAKFRILAERVLRGETLFHPDDARTYNENPAFPH